MIAGLTVNEIFRSIQGEGTRAGRPCVFIRLTGCNLRRSWCDTRYAWQAGREMTLDQIMCEISAAPCRLVEVTGGEPLHQLATPQLLRRLCDEAYEVLLETNGSLDISVVDPRVARIVDFKCPSSASQDSNLWPNVSALTARDEVKFVLADRTDYQFAREAIARHRLDEICPVILSCVSSALGPAALAGWILEDGLNVRLGLQLHKIIWPDKDRGV